MKKKIAIITFLAFMVTIISGIGVGAAMTGKTQMTNFDSGSINTDMWHIRSIKPNGDEDPNLVSIQDGALVFAGAGDGCSFGPTGIYKDFTMTFDVLEAQEGSTFIGLAFGMDNPFDNFWVPGGNMVYLQVANTDAFKDELPLLGTDPAGVGTDNGGGRGWTRPGYELWSGDGPNPEVLNYKLTVKNGSAYVYYKKASDPIETLNELRIRFAGFGDTTGFVKIVSTAGANYTIDNFKIFNENAIVENFDGDDYNSDLWHINSVNGSEQDPTKVSVNDGAIVFAGAGDGCFFGLKDTYKDFILDFDIVEAQEGSTFIGLAFGMDNLEDNFWAAGGNMVYLQVANTDAFKDELPLLGTDPAGVGTDNGGGRGWTRPGYELWSGEGPNPEVLNYRLVVKNGNAEVYYKKASDPIETLDVLRIRFAGFGDTTGYFKFVSTAGGSFTLDNINFQPFLDTTVAISDESDVNEIQMPTSEMTAAEQNKDINSIDLSWDADDAASLYRVNVYTKGQDNSYTYLKSVMVEDATQVTIDGLNEDTMYGFQVTSFDENGFVNNYYTTADIATAVTQSVDSSVDDSSVDDSNVDDGTETPSDNSKAGIVLMLALSAGMIFVAVNKSKKTAQN